MEPLRVGVSFWAQQIISYHACGEPMDFTIIGETKTLWRCKRTSYTEEQVKPFTIKKDMSEWMQISPEDAENINWMRANSIGVSNAVSRIADFNKEHVTTLKAIAAIIGYKEK